MLVKGVSKWRFHFTSIRVSSYCVLFSVPYVYQLNSCTDQLAMKAEANQYCDDMSSTMQW